MSTETSTTLPERDFLKMEIALGAVQITRQPQPNYRLIFRINLLNTANTSVRLLGRKWLLRDSHGSTRIVEAQKVFNERPVLAPGSIFSIGGCQDFNCPPTRVELRFFGVDQVNTPFITPPLAFPSRALRVR